MLTSEKNFYIKAINVLNSSLDIVKAMDRFISYIKTVMPIDNIHMGIYESELKSIRNLITTTENGIEWVDELIPLHEKTAEYIENSFDLKPMFINDLALDKNLGPMLNLAPPKYSFYHNRKISTLALPLVIEG